jgi:hypothetical protein
MTRLPTCVSGRSFDRKLGTGACRPVRLRQRDRRPRLLPTGKGRRGMLRAPRRGSPRGRGKERLMHGRKSQPTARTLSRRTVSLVRERGQIVACRSRIAARRLCRFDAPSFLFDMRDEPRRRMQLRVGIAFSTAGTGDACRVQRPDCETKARQPLSRVPSPMFRPTTKIRAWSERRSNQAFRDRGWRSADDMTRRPSVPSLPCVGEGGGVGWAEYLFEQQVMSRHRWQAFDMWTARTRREARVDDKGRRRRSARRVRQGGTPGHHAHRRIFSADDSTALDAGGWNSGKTFALRAELRAVECADRAKLGMCGTAPASTR